MIRLSSPGLLVAVGEALLGTHWQPSGQRVSGSEEACLSAYAALNSASAGGGNHVSKTDIKRASKQLGVVLAPGAVREILSALTGSEAGLGIDLPAFEAATGAYFTGQEDRGGPALLFRALRALLHAAGVTPCGVCFRDAAANAFAALAGPAATEGATIGPEELMAGAQRMGCSLSEAAAEAIVWRYDDDGDRCLGLEVATTPPSIH